MSSMKAGNKEINIINMSLLDILCGAMGAFCFMMLALFPYWSPEGVGAKESAQMAEQMQREIERMKEQLRRSGGPGAADAMERLEKLQRQMQQMEGQNNDLRSKLEEEKKKVRTLEIRNPVVVAAIWTAAGPDIDVYVHAPGLKTNAGNMQPPVDANAKQGRFFFGDYMFSMRRGPGMDFWLMRDTVAGSRCDVYYKYMASNGHPQPVTVFGYYVHDSRQYELPNVDLRREKTAYKVGSLLINGDYSVKFEPVPEMAEPYRKQLEASRRAQ